MLFIAHCFLLFAVLQFVVITGYYASLRLAKNKKTKHSKHHPTDVFRLNPFAVTSFPSRCDVLNNRPARIQAFDISDKLPCWRAGHASAMAN